MIDRTHATHACGVCNQFPNYKCYSNVIRLSIDASSLSAPIQNRMLMCTIWMWRACACAFIIRTFCVYRRMGEREGQCAFTLVCWRQRHTELKTHSPALCTTSIVYVIVLFSILFVRFAAHFPFGGPDKISALSKPNVCCCIYRRCFEPAFVRHFKSDIRTASTSPIVRTWPPIRASATRPDTQVRLVGNVVFAEYPKSSWHLSWAHTAGYDTWHRRAGLL